MEAFRMIDSGGEGACQGTRLLDPSLRVRTLVRFIKFKDVEVSYLYGVHGNPQITPLASKVPNKDAHAFQ